ncbi:hypothetical protein AB4402_09380 [Vibrio breoganii]
MSNKIQFHVMLANASILGRTYLAQRHRRFQLKAGMTPMLSSETVAFALSDS